MPASGMWIWRKRAGRGKPKNHETILPVRFRIECHSMQGHSAFWFARGLRRNGLMASLIRVENVAGKGARAVEARVNETRKKL